MQQLTAAKAAKYYGCDVLVKNNVHEVHSIGIAGIKVFDDSSDDRLRMVSYQDCQLLLTPLEKITREHAVVWYRVEFPQQREGMGDEERFLRVANWIGMKLQMSQKGADLLRSFGYDCDNYLVTGEAVEDGAV